MADTTTDTITNVNAFTDQSHTWLNTQTFANNISVSSLNGITTSDDEGIETTSDINLKGIVNADNLFITTSAQCPTLPVSANDLTNKSYVDSKMTNFPLLSFIWSDHKVSDLCWILSDGKTWYSGDVYKNAYSLLLEEYNNGTDASDTIGGITISYKRGPKGLKVCAASQKTNLDNLYNATGVAWYYILKTDSDTSFMLPRTKYGFQGIKGSNGVGTYDQPGLPNITGKIDASNSDDTQECFGETYQAKTTVEGAMYAIWGNHQAIADGGSTSYSQLEGFGIDASGSNAIYGASTTVQPPATEMYLYFCAGEYIQDDVTTMKSIVAGAVDLCVKSTDASRIIIITESEYNDLASPQSDTIYMLKEG